MDDTPHAELALPSPAPSESAAPADDALPPPSDDLEGVRRQVHALASSQDLDKPAALTVLRLFHAMETLLRHECAARDRALHDALHALKRERLHAELERLTRQRTLEGLQQAAAQPTPDEGRPARRARHW
jgi:hypothetical protein